MLLVYILYIWNADTGVGTILVGNKPPCRNHPRAQEPPPCGNHPCVGTTPVWELPPPAGTHRHIYIYIYIYIIIYIIYILYLLHGNAGNYSAQYIYIYISTYMHSQAGNATARPAMKPEPAIVV